MWTLRVAWEYEPWAEDSLNKIFNSCLKQVTNPTCAQIIATMSLGLINYNRICSQIEVSSSIIIIGEQCCGSPVRWRICGAGTPPGTVHFKLILMGLERVNYKIVTSSWYRTTHKTLRKPSKIYFFLIH